MIRVLITAVTAVLSWVLLLPVFLLTGAAWLFATSVRAVGRLMEPRFVPWTDLMTFDQRLGWRPRPNLDVNYLAQRDDVFHIITDQEGWQGTRTLDDSPMVVIGDSFAFGYGIDTGKSFADLNPKLAIKGIGAPGYSMVQPVLLMEQFAERLKGKLVVWFVCLENDLEDNLAPAMTVYRSPFVRPSRQHGEWEIVQDHVGPSPWLSSVWGSGRKRILPYLCVPGPLADRTYAGSDYLIGRAAAACSLVGAKLVLITVPDPTQLTVESRAKLAVLSGSPGACDVDLPDKRIAESCKRHGVPIIVGKDHLSASDYKPIEGLHWNARGHRRMADVLGRVYESFRSGAIEGSASKSHSMVATERLARLDESTAISR
jgi:hypothetical protein